MFKLGNDFGLNKFFLLRLFICFVSACVCVCVCCFFFHIFQQSSGLIFLLHLSRQDIYFEGIIYIEVYRYTQYYKLFIFYTKFTTRLWNSLSLSFNLSFFLPFIPSHCCNCLLSLPFSFIDSLFSHGYFVWGSSKK